MATYHLFAPTGHPIVSVLTRGWQSQAIGGIDAQGNYTFQSGCYPELLDEWGSILSDEPGHEWLAGHCRLRGVIETYNPYSPGLDNQAKAWPDHIVEACIEASDLAQCLEHLQEAKTYMNHRLDDTQQLVLKRFFVDKISGQLDDLNTRISEWRAANPEPDRIIGLSDDELLELAEQKHAAQMADMEEPTDALT